MTRSGSLGAEAKLLEVYGRHSYAARRLGGPFLDPTLDARCQPSARQVVLESTDVDDGACGIGRGLRGRLTGM
jgi:hypothetical protein